MVVYPFLYLMGINTLMKRGIEERSEEVAQNKF